MTTSVILVGGGGVEWEFDLPLTEVFADQVKKGELRPKDEESAAAVAYLTAVDEPELSDPVELTGSDEGQKPVGEKTIDEMTGKELDAFAAELKLDGWKPKANLAAKRDALKAAVVEKLRAAQTDGDGLEGLTDDELAEKVEELELQVDDDADRDTVIAAIRERLAAA